VEDILEGQVKAKASGRRWLESRIRENRTSGLMRGSWR